MRFLNKYLIRLNVIFPLFLYELGCLFAGSSELVVDTTIVRYLDLSDVAQKEKIIYNLKVVDWNTPVNFRIFILSQNDTVLSLYSENEDKYDDLFRDPEYMIGCSTFVECKRNWFDLFMFYLLVSK